ncbi:hypothetical protein LNTAR_15362 [Lentisphaera araneosa HTCC2155]|uniref:Uncharacterized protein n=1 Tax=Lentisphaera araneosa HTCC2155 TaxID=313628 RepID=A6DU57_9BACT|nr:hypothetical protein [Lentisphaera araneosa]EDM24816.1 hypothetical protein LNTAR_15362 [Lentisphaera araneosa HTCC2155]
MIRTYVIVRNSQSWLDGGTISFKITTLQRPGNGICTYEFCITPDDNEFCEDKLKSRIYTEYHWNHENSKLVKKNSELETTLISLLETVIRNNQSNQHLEAYKRILEIENKSNEQPNKSIEDLLQKEKSHVPPHWISDRAKEFLNQYRKNN